jgi:pilus assembly protein CpaB
MNRRLTTILVVALAIAGLCSLAAFRLMSRRAEAAKPAPTTRVVTAARDIKLGTVLAASDVTLADVNGQPPKGSFLKLEDALGRGAVASIFQGETVLESRLAARGSGGGLASTIPQGMRACAVRVDEVVGVAGFVTAGQRVDVLASGMRSGANMMPTNAGDGFTSRIILQNIQVLSAGTDIQKDAEGKPKTVQVVNLLVTPEQAETLSLATNQLRIQLVLRNPMDTTVTAVHSMAMGNLMSDEPLAALPEPRHGAASQHRKTGTVPVNYSVEILNGTTRTEEHFKMPEVKQ